MKSFIDIVSEDTNLAYLVASEPTAITEDTADMLMATRSFEETSAGIQAVLIAMEGSISLYKNYVVKEADGDNGSGEKKDEPGFFKRVWENLKSMCKSIYVAFLKFFERITRFFMNIATKIWIFFENKLEDAENSTESFIDDTLGGFLPVQEAAIDSNTWTRAANNINIECTAAQVAMGREDNLANFRGNAEGMKKISECVNAIISIPDADILKQEDKIKEILATDVVEKLDHRVTVKLSQLFPSYNLAVDHIKNANRSIEGMSFLKKQLDNVNSILERKFSEQKGDPKAARIRLLVFNKMTRTSESMYRRNCKEIIGLSRLGLIAIKKVKAYKG